MAIFEALHSAESTHRDNAKKAEEEHKNRINKQLSRLEELLRIKNAADTSVVDLPEAAEAGAGVGSDGAPGIPSGKGPGMEVDEEQTQQEPSLEAKRKAAQEELAAKRKKVAAEEAKAAAEARLVAAGESCG